MTLRVRILAIVGTTLVALLTVIYLCSAFVLRGTFDRLEMQVARQNAVKARDIALGSIPQLSATLSQWSGSDRTDRLMAREDSAGLAAITGPLLRDTQGDLVVFYKPDGKVVYAARRAAGGLAPLSEEMLAFFRHPAFVAQDTATGSPRSAFVWTDQRLMCLYSRRVHNDNYEDSHVGRVVVGRYLTEEEEARFRQLSGARLEIIDLTKRDVPSDVWSALYGYDPGSELILRPLNNEEIGAYVVLMDIRHHPRTVIRWVLPRDIHRYGLATLRYITGSLAVLGLVFTALTLGLLENLLLRRMKTLNDSVNSLTEHGRLDERIPVTSDDEIGMLTSNINGMLASMERSQNTLVDREERLSRIVETNADAILMVDLEGNISFANTAAEAIFGLERESLHNMAYDDVRWRLKSLTGRATDTDTVRFWKTIREGGQVRGLEHTMRNAEGSRLILSVNAAPLRDASGEIIACVASVSDITERKMLEEQLAHQAFHDPLTGLPNRALFWDRLEKAHARFTRRRSPLAVLFLDLDNFKYVNDSLGHSAGDQLLIGVAQRIGSCLRDCDTVARLGGDEFTVLVEDLDDERDAFALANRILAQMQEPFWIANREIFVGVSIGISVAGLDTLQPEELMRHADAALYAAKDEGKNRIAIFHDGMGTDATARLDLESDLRHALERHEMVVYYQPKVALDTGRMIGMEALVRWRHPTRGLVPPGEFIALAEETGLILPLGEWVLREACLQAHDWARQHEAAHGWLMSVNISARQFQQADFAATVGRVLRETGMDPGRLSLEVTESIIMGDTESTTRTLRALKTLGVLLAIDDFGTGYSSLSYLRRFPMDIVKIDRSFIQGLCVNEQDSAIVSATIKMAHALGLTVVAEGAETPEQAHELRRLGCDLAQGFVFTHPLDASGLLPYLHGQSQPLLNTLAATET